MNLGVGSIFLVWYSSFYKRSKFPSPRCKLTQQPLSLSNYGNLIFCQVSIAFQRNLSPPLVLPINMDNITGGCLTYHDWRSILNSNRNLEKYSFQINYGHKNGCKLYIPRAIWKTNTCTSEFFNGLKILRIRCTSVIWGLWKTKECVLFLKLHETPCYYTLY